MWSSGIVATADSDTKPLGYFRKVVPTTIDVQEAKNGSCSLLKIVTVDRPGLLVDIVRALKDISLNVVSAEIDTVGIEASDEFFVTYHGACDVCGWLGMFVGLGVRVGVGVCVCSKADRLDELDHRRHGMLVLDPLQVETMLRDQLCQHST